MHLGGDARGNGRQRHQRGVGRLLAADDDQRPVLPAQPGQALAPGILAAEQPHDHDIGGRQQRGKLGQGEARRVGEQVPGSA
jgi:hypothetical protein